MKTPLSTIKTPLFITKALATLLCASLFLSGCAGSLSGYGGSTTFKCDAPQGVSCNSISGNYANSVAGNDLTRVKGTANAGTQPYNSAQSNDAYSPNARFTPSSGMPVRTQSEVMRIWIAPWQDNDGDLVDQSYTYVTLNEGRWLIEHNRKQIMDDYMPETRLLGSGNNSTSSNTPSGTKTSDQSGTDKSDVVPNILPGDFPK